MVKHASSHGFSVLLCTVLASFLVEALKPYYPELLNKVESISRRLIEIFGVPLNVEYLTVVLIASITAVLWGAIFKLRYVEATKTPRFH